MGRSRRARKMSCALVAVFLVSSRLGWPPVAWGESTTPPSPNCFYLRVFLDNPKRALDATQTRFVENCQRVNVGASEEDCESLEGAIQASTNRLAQVCGWVFPEKAVSSCEELSNNPDRKQVIGLLISQAENRALALRCEL